MAYSSWSDKVQLCIMQGDFQVHESLDFSPDFRSCMFSIRFSPSARQLIAGMNHGASRKTQN